MAFVLERIHYAAKLNYQLCKVNGEYQFTSPEIYVECGITGYNKVLSKDEGDYLSTDYNLFFAVAYLFDQNNKISFSSGFINEEDSKNFGSNISEIINKVKSLSYEEVLKIKESVVLTKEQEEWHKKYTIGILVNNNDIPDERNAVEESDE